MVIFCAKGFTPHREKKASPSPAPISGDRSGEIRFDFVQCLSPAFDEFRHDFVQRLSPAFAEFRLGFVQHLPHLLFSGTAFFAAARKVAPPSPLLSDGERAGSDGEDSSRKPPNSDSVSCGISSIFSTSSDLVSCSRFPLFPTNSDSISCSALPCLRRIPT